MFNTIDHTHDQMAHSWVHSANAAETDFPLQNLPLGVFIQGNEPAHIGVRVGEEILDLARLSETGLADLEPREIEVLRKPTLNSMMSLGRPTTHKLRHAVFDLLHARTQGAVRERVARCLLPVDACTMMLPSAVGDFTDFYTSIHHARRAGEAIRGDASLNPNFQSIPIAYHGRSSSIVISGTSCQRPYGKTNLHDGYRLSEKLDFELEFGFYVGPDTQAKTQAKAPLSVEMADAHLFGFCLVNDWSARDIQRWESAPLGPFLAKSFLTTTSAWVVTTEALSPFRVAPAPREKDAPPLLAELDSAQHAAMGGFDVALSVTLQSRAMRDAGIDPVVIGKPNFRDQYWTPAQMIAHHASNGCPLRSGDLISSGTVSGPERGDSGCLLERTMDGRAPLTLPSGEQRGYLLDGDRVAFSGRCSRTGFRSIGFGSCSGEVHPLD